MAEAIKKENKDKAYKSARSRLYDQYRKEVVKALMKQNGYTNVNQVPKLDKIVLNMGLGTEKDNSKSYNLAVEELTLIAGQKAVSTLAKKSIAGFRVREDQKIGAKVTLRGQKMYQFLDKLISVALPRVRDFRGVNEKSFDGKGNWALGIKDHTIFPEISFDKIEKVRGFDIIVVTTAKTNKECYDLLKALGVPFRGGFNG
ncbi:MAG: 50S ribosomal protein L5 [Firmicutes bacterium]|nr:50S ribosomal protein L5 [Bacillota bacterium]MCL2770817.1 50S ribosomal protein L5 [Bacillota bacterium]